MSKDIQNYPVLPVLEKRKLYALKDTNKFSSIKVGLIFLPNYIIYPFQWGKIFCTFRAVVIFLFLCTISIWYKVYFFECTGHKRRYSDEFRTKSTCWSWFCFDNCNSMDKWQTKCAGVRWIYSRFPAQHLATYG